MQPITVGKITMFETGLTPGSRESLDALSCLDALTQEEAKCTVLFQTVNHSATQFDCHRRVSHLTLTPDANLMHNGF